MRELEQRAHAQYDSRVAAATSMDSGKSQAALAAQGIHPDAMDKNLLSFLPKRQSLDLSFRDIYYKVLALSLNKKPVMKEILHGVSGDFQAGQLTAILGPSGAGKSTLLNILAGFTARGLKGDVLVNGKVRNPREFSHQSCYIMQENELRPLLTARESMKYAATLKLSGGKHAPSEKALYLQITEILDTLGLSECQDTRSGALSGGQRRRLSIALELLNNPPIMFLDEPTTGLDSASCVQCVELLRFLARGGRTIVITIHQPSARLFERFDQVYTVAEGHCLYRGSPQGLLPFLARHGLSCPPYHNPADFLLEVASGEHGDHGLIEAASREQPVKSDLTPSVNLTVQNLHIPGEIPVQVPDVNLTAAVNSGRRCSPIRQFWCLYKRNITILRRDYKQMLLRLVCHISIGVIFGYLYRGVGSDAEGALANWVYIYGTNLFLMYTGQMAVTLSFPLEINVLTREHFNKWYSLVPYLASTVCVELPFQVVSAFSYLGISYLMTSQPLEIARIVPFFCLCTLTTISGQALGFLSGAALPVTIAVFVGPVVAVLLSIFGFCITLRDTPLLFKWLFHISYFRASFQGAIYSLYGYGRGNLDCDQFYCHFKYPQKILTEMDVPLDLNLVHNGVFVITASIIMIILTYVVLWIRLHKR